jgi:hypothetical protein
VSPAVRPSRSSALLFGSLQAYQQVTWYFPQHGQTPADNGGTPINACSGP